MIVIVVPISFSLFSFPLFLSFLRIVVDDLANFPNLKRLSRFLRSRRMTAEDGVDVVRECVVEMMPVAFDLKNEHAAEAAMLLRDAVGTRRVAETAGLSFVLQFVARKSAQRACSRTAKGACMS